MTRRELLKLLGISAFSLTAIGTATKSLLSVNKLDPREWYRVWEVRGEDGNTFPLITKGEEKPLWEQLKLSMPDISEISKIEEINPFLKLPDDKGIDLIQWWRDKAINAHTRVVGVFRTNKYGEVSQILDRKSIPDHAVYTDMSFAESFQLAEKKVIPEKSKEIWLRRAIARAKAV